MAMIVSQFIIVCKVIVVTKHFRFRGSGLVAIGMSTQGRNFVLTDMTFIYPV